MAVTAGQRSLRSRGSKGLCGFAVVLAFALVAVPVASADPVFTVDSTADASDATPGDATCETAATECTLRAAIEELDAGGVAGTIEFDIPTTVPLVDVATI